MSGVDTAYAAGVVDSGACRVNSPLGGSVLVRNRCRPVPPARFPRRGSPHRATSRSAVDQDTRRDRALLREPAEKNDPGLGLAPAPAADWGAVVKKTPI